MSETVGEILASMVAPAPRSSTRAQCPKCLAEVACETLEFEHGKQIITQTTFAAHGTCGRHTAHGYRDRPGFEDATTTKGMPKARDPEERLCPCGKTFTVLQKHSPQQFCGRDCTAKGRTHGARTNPHKRELKKCEWCERQFEPMKPKVRFCSKRCAALHNNDARGALTEEERGQPLGEPASPPPSQEPDEEVAMQPEPEPQTMENDACGGCGGPIRADDDRCMADCTGIRAKAVAETMAAAREDMEGLHRQIEDLQSKLVEAEETNGKLQEKLDFETDEVKGIDIETMARLDRPHRLAGYLAEKVPARLLFAAAGLAKCLESEGQQ